MDSISGGFRQISYEYSWKFVPNIYRIQYILARDNPGVWKKKIINKLHYKKNTWLN